MDIYAEVVSLLDKRMKENHPNDPVEILADMTIAKKVLDTGINMVLRQHPLNQAQLIADGVNRGNEILKAMRDLHKEVTTSIAKMKGGNDEKLIP